MSARSQLLICARLCQVDIEVQRLLRHRDLHPAEAHMKSGLRQWRTRLCAPCFCAAPSHASALQPSWRALLHTSFSRGHWFAACGSVDLPAARLDALGMRFAKTFKREVQLARTARGAVQVHSMHHSVRACRLAAPGHRRLPGVPCRMRRRWRWGSGLHRGRVRGSASQASLVSAGQHTTLSAPLLPPPAAPNGTNWP